MKRNFFSLAITLLLWPGCAMYRHEQGAGELALLSLDLRDLAQAGTIYGLAENPAWQLNLTVIQGQLKAAAQTDCTSATLQAILQAVPMREFRGTRARLDLAGRRMVLHQPGRNVDLAGIKDCSALAQGLSEGVAAGLKEAAKR